MKFDSQVTPDQQNQSQIGVDMDREFVQDAHEAPEQSSKADARDTPTCGCSGKHGKGAGEGHKQSSCGCGGKGHKKGHGHGDAYHGCAHEDEVVDDHLSDEQEADQVGSEAFDELRQAQELAAQMQDRYTRLQAEWENFRKRTAQEAEATKTRSTQYLVEALIPVLDDIERALEHGQQANPEGEFKAFCEGLAAVHGKLLSALESKARLEVIDPAGEPFDALKHQAVGHVENAEVFEDTVADVYQKGYEQAGYVIRPAMVTITTGGPQRPSDEA